ncbi:Aste57867_21885 [Aphanomyces stellatus]|uniref:Aste57867_21885 protein n=1 Tax=Aphanomyces stellatus TaxID=120398 RepID=A0A485LIQ1_9STRA|nr:hypothetical protein As57867_021816 [Aphanomyces stellatus]VFT98553.1 Aste57867_21885 [Aphanomyces stellatus]
MTAPETPVAPFDQVHASNMVQPTASSWTQARTTESRRSSVSSVAHSGDAMSDAPNQPTGRFPGSFRGTLTGDTTATHTERQETSCRRKKSTVMTGDRMDDYVNMSDHLMRRVKRGNKLSDLIDTQQREFRSGTHRTSASLAAKCMEPIRNPPTRLKRRGIAFDAQVSFHTDAGARLAATACGKLVLGAGPPSRFFIRRGPWHGRTNMSTLTVHDSFALELARPDGNSRVLLQSTRQALYDATMAVGLARDVWSDDGRTTVEETLATRLYRAYAWQVVSERTDDRVLSDGMRVALVQEHDGAVYELVPAMNEIELRRRRTTTMAGRDGPTPLTLILKLHDTPRKARQKRPPPPPVRRKPWLTEAIDGLKGQMAAEAQKRAAHDERMHNNMAAYAQAHSLESARCENANDDDDKPAKPSMKKVALAVFVKTFKKVHREHVALGPELNDDERLKVMQCYNPRIYGRVGAPPTRPRSSSYLKFLSDGLDKVGEPPPALAIHPLLRPKSSTERQSAADDGGGAAQDGAELRPLVVQRKAGLTLVIDLEYVEELRAEKQRERVWTIERKDVEWAMDLDERVVVQESKRFFWEDRVNKHAGTNREQWRGRCPGLENGRVRDVVDERSKDGKAFFVDPGSQDAKCDERTRLGHIKRSVVECLMLCRP